MDEMEEEKDEVIDSNQFFNINNSRIENKK